MPEIQATVFRCDLCGDSEAVEGKASPGVPENLRKPPRGWYWLQVPDRRRLVCGHCLMLARRVADQASGKHQAGGEELPHYIEALLDEVAERHDSP